MLKKNSLISIFLEKFYWWKYGIKFQKGEASDFFETVCTYVFWRTDYEYNSENCQLVDFHGKMHEHHMKIMVFGVYIRKFWKMFQTNVVALIKIYILCLINFFDSTNSFRKIRWKSLWHETLPRIGWFFFRTIWKMYH